MCRQNKICPVCHFHLDICCIQQKGIDIIHYDPGKS